MTAATYCTVPYPVDPYVQPGTCRTCGYVGHVTKYGGMRPHLARTPAQSDEEKPAQDWNSFQSDTNRAMWWRRAIEHRRDGCSECLDGGCISSAGDLGTAAITEDPS